MNESIVIRLNSYEIEILEEFRQSRIENLTQAMKKEQNELAKSCYMNDIERFKRMNFHSLLSECLNTIKHLKEGNINSQQIFSCL